MVKMTSSSRTSMSSSESNSTLAVVKGFFERVDLDAVSILEDDLVLLYGVELLLLLELGFIVCTVVVDFGSIALVVRLLNFVEVDPGLFSLIVVDFDFVVVDCVEMFVGKVLDKNVSDDIILLDFVA